MAILGLSTYPIARSHRGARKCEFCPNVMRDEFVALKVPENKEMDASLSFMYGWMAGGSSHKLMMLKEVLDYFPGLIHVEGLYPMGGLKRHGLDIAKAYENPIERDGVVITLDKLDHYWIPFRDNMATAACRQHRHDSTGCDKDHLFFASDINVWAVPEGLSKDGGGVPFRNPDEEIDGWNQLNVADKQAALVDFMTHGYQKVGTTGNVTNIVETATAFRIPRGITWMDDPVTFAGASRMYVSMPLESMTNRVFVNDYIERVKRDVKGTNNSLDSDMDVLNSIAGAAGGVLIEKMIQHLVENGESVRISLPPRPKLFLDAMGGRELSDWDQIRGHASGFPHVMVWTLMDLMSKNRFRPPRRPVIVRGSGTDFEPSVSDAQQISSQMWKNK